VLVGGGGWAGGVGARGGWGWERWRGGPADEGEGVAGEALGWRGGSAICEHTDVGARSVEGGFWGGENARVGSRGGSGAALGVGGHVEARWVAGGVPLPPLPQGGAGGGDGTRDGFWARWVVAGDLMGGGGAGGGRSGGGGWVGVGFWWGGGGGRGGGGGGGVWVGASSFGGGWGLVRGGGAKVERWGGGC